MKKLRLTQTPQAILAISLFSCLHPLAIADSLADKSLKNVATSPSASQAVTVTSPQAKLSLSTAPSKLETLANKAQQLRTGTGLLGKNISPVIGKDIVGIQYSTQW